MITLNGNTEKLQAVMSTAITTTTPDFWASWTQINSDTLITADSVGGTLNGVADVDLVTGFSARQVKVTSLDILNRDTVAQTITIKMDVSGTDRHLFKCTLQVGDSMH